MQQEVKIGYIISNGPKKNKSIRIEIENTGLDANNTKHRESIETILQTVIPIMYARANDIPIDKIKYNNVETNEQGTKRI